MQKTKICLCLTAPTLKEDLELTERYQEFIDLVELRVDCLIQSERMHIRQFPRLSPVPAILTIRRQSDGGKFIEGEGARTVLMARGLSFADLNASKNFAYVDLEDDFYIPSIEEAVYAFGTRIIRSKHSVREPIKNIAAVVRSMHCGTGDICKIAFQAHSLSDVTHLFREAELLRDREVILIAMGPYGVPSRILAPKLGSVIAFTSPAEVQPDRAAAPGQIDPITLLETYNFRSIDRDTKAYGVMGYPLAATKSPELHNLGYRRDGIHAAYIPIRSDTVEEALDFADALKIQGISVTVPFKEAVAPYMAGISAEAAEIGSINTIVRENSVWHGYNTDADGFEQALLEFLNRENLKNIKVAIIGAGGAAKAVAFAVKRRGGKACVFNRTVYKAKQLAQAYKFRYAPLNSSSIYMLEQARLIIQTTSVGMSPNSDGDPLDFYSFSGKEAVFDIIYEPEKTKLLQRAEKAGCAICNGYSMLKYQAALQYKLYTGSYYPREEKTND